MHLFYGFSFSLTKPTEIGYTKNIFKTRYIKKIVYIFFNVCIKLIFTIISVERAIKYFCTIFKNFFKKWRIILCFDHRILNIHISILCFEHRVIFVCILIRKMANEIYANEMRILSRQYWVTNYHCYYSVPLNLHWIGIVLIWFD